MCHVRCPINPLGSEGIFLFVIVVLGHANNLIAPINLQLHVDVYRNMFLHTCPLFKTVAPSLCS